MCGRYTLAIEAKSDAKLMGYFGNDPSKIPKNFNAAPSQTMPVIVKTPEKGDQMELMHWGIPRMIGKDAVKEIINTHSDKAFERFWGKTVLHKRCLIPATGFYEWKKTAGGKQPFFIRPDDQSLFYFAGIWSEWTNKDGKTFNSFSIMTTEPNDQMKEVHNRMPVILSPEEHQQWLEAESREEIEPLLHPYHDGGLLMFEVSKDVNNVRNNSKELLKPLDEK